MKPGKSKSKDKKLESSKKNKEQEAKKSSKQIKSIQRKDRFNPDSDEYWET